MAKTYRLTEGSVRRLNRVADKVESTPTQGLRYRGGANGNADVYRILIGKADAAVTQGNSGTVSIWSGSTSASLSDSTENATGVYARFGDVASGAWVAIAELPWGYEFLQTTCPP